MSIRTLLILLVSGALMTVACSDETSKNGSNGPDVRTFDDGGTPNNGGTSDAGNNGGTDDAGNNGGTDDAGNNGGTDDAGDDGGSDMGTVTCDSIAVGQTLDIDDGTEAGQLYADTAFDGENVWVTYNRYPDDQTQEEAIFAVRIGCDGTVGDPIRLSTDTGRRNYWPAIAAGQDTTFVVWVSDQGGAKKFIMYQGLKKDGTKRLSEPADITPAGEVETVSDLIWELDVAALPNDRAVLVGAAGNLTEFQAVAQRFRADGTRDGNGFFPYTEKGVDQSKPTVTADSDGTIYMAWTRYKAADSEAGTPEQPESVVFTSVPTNATEAFPSPPPPAAPLSDPNPLASYADEPGPNGEYFLAFQETSSTAWDILVRDGSDVEATTSATFGTPQRRNFRPDIAGGPEGGVVAWYRFASSPTQNDVMLNWFEVDAQGNYTKGSEMPVSTTDPAIPPYGPRIVHVTGKTYFVTWSEGSGGPEARVKGRFVSF